MKIARLGAAAGAAGIVALGTAGPALATTPSPPSGDVSKLDTGNKPVGKPGSGPMADVNPKFFYGGDTLTFTFKNCGVKPTITDLNNLFVHTNPFKPTPVKGSWATKEITHKNLVEGREYKVKVVCGTYTVTFSTRPHKKPKPTPTMKNPTAKPTTTVPSGAPQTGDGSANGGGNTGLMVGGIGVAVVGLAGGGLLYARRRSSAGA